MLRGSTTTHAKRIYKAADKSAWRCRPHGAAGASRAWGRAVPEGALGETRCLVHTGHNGACASAPQTVWARWSAGAVAGLACVAARALGADRLARRNAA